MKRAIITGATGAVGTALVQELIEKDIEVLVLCRAGSSRNSVIPEHPLVERKYCQLSELESLKNDTGKEYDVFYHFAWEGTTGAAREDMYLQNKNVRYALAAVETAARFGCKRFIGAGSQAEYGRAEGMLRPDTPVFPETGYGMGKLCAGLMTRSRAAQLGVEHIWVRILSVYGPNDGAGSMVMSAIAKMRANTPPPLTKGEQLWDYLYSGDAAEAMRLIGERGVSGKTYVLGSGKACPLKNYIECIRALVNPDCFLDFGAIPYGEKQVMHLQADISELTEDTGWQAKTDFSQGIARILRSQES